MEAGNGQDMHAARPLECVQNPLADLLTITDQERPVDRCGTLGQVLVDDSSDLSADLFRQGVQGLGQGGLILQSVDVEWRGDATADPDVILPEIRLIIKAAWIADPVGTGELGPDQELIAGVDGSRKCSFDAEQETAMGRPEGGILLCPHGLGVDQQAGFFQVKDRHLSQGGVEHDLLLPGDQVEDVLVMGRLLQGQAAVNPAETYGQEQEEKQGAGLVPAAVQDKCDEPCPCADQKNDWRDRWQQCRQEDPCGKGQGYAQKEIGGDPGAEHGHGIKEGLGP